MAQKTANHDSFALGVGLGVVLGVAGYLAYTTPKSTSVRKRLQDEFNRLREVLYTEQFIKDPNISLPELVGVLRGKAAEVADALEPSGEGAPGKAGRRQRRSYSRKKQKTFTGV